MVASPIIHFTHEDGLKTGFAALGVRLGAPIVAGLIGIAATSAAQDQCDRTGEGRGDLGCLQTLSGALVGGLVGMLGAMIADDVFLAREPEHEEVLISLALRF